MRDAPSLPDLQHIERAFAARGWRVFDYQRAVWRAQGAGESGLTHAPTGTGTGTGKTLAAWLGLLIDLRTSHATTPVATCWPGICTPC